MAEQKKSKKKDEVDALENIVSMAGKGIVSLFQHPFRLIVFVVVIAICTAAVKNYESVAVALGISAEQMKAGVYLSFLIPLILLIGFGSMNNAVKSMAEKFESIKFANKVGQHPTVKSTYRDRKDRRIKIIEFYSPGLPIKEWNQRKEEIESVLDCTILMLKRDADSKQTVIAKTVSSKYKVPKSIDWDDKYIYKEDFLLSVGEGLLGPITVNLNATPHAIVGGSTGSGKSVMLRSLLWQSIKKGARIYIVDFKGGVEFDRRWEDFAEVVMDQEPALTLLQQLVIEMKARFALFRSEIGVKNIADYNKKYPERKICHIVLACDELAELLDKEGVTDKDEKQMISQINRCISSLARLGRAPGIHMLMGMQRPDAKVLNGQIKNNAPIRVCGQAESVLSEIVLGNPKASEISTEEKGRFFCNIGGLQEIQGYWFTDDLLVDGNYQVGRMLTEGQEATTEEAQIDENEYQEFEVSKKEQEQWGEEIHLEGIQV